MAKKVDLRAQTAGFGAPPAPAKPLATQDGMPIQPGTVVRADALSPMEKQLLKQYDWKEGDPIPNNIGEIIEAAKTEALRYEPPAPLDTPPLQFSSVNISTLPEEKQAEVRAALKAAAAAGVAEIEDIPQLGEGLAAAAAGVARDIEIEDDLAADAKAQQVIEDSLEASGVEHLCPRCGWDTRIQDIEPTNEDKQTYLHALLGDLPFMKTFQLLGGQLQIRFRTLGPAEADLCFKQACRDYMDENSNVRTEMDRMEQMMRYRMALQVVSVRTPGGLVELPTTITDYENASVGTDGTPLPSIYAFFCQELTKTEERRRVIMQTLVKFNRLVGNMEANVETPDFWAAAS